MFTLEARNVNEALFIGAHWLREVGVPRDSRNGPVLMAPKPVTTVYENPTERVLLHPDRDANPYFHLVEALWMIAGRNDLKTLTAYVKNMANFSDDGGRTQPGAYGHRWREHFFTMTGHRAGDPRERAQVVLDQLAWAVKRLRADPNDRRVVIQMYDPEVDQPASDRGGKDIPCNLSALPTISVDGRLDLTVFNRSNDMVWGAYGANAVHFSVLQELIAALVGVPVGRYYQVSNNFHVYLATLGKAGTEWPWNEHSRDQDGNVVQDLATEPYTAGLVQPFAMFHPDDELDWITNDIEMFLEDPARVGIQSPFLRKIACPMVMSHRAYKSGDLDGAREILDQMPRENDWRAAAVLWLNNRAAARAKKEAAE